MEDHDAVPEPQPPSSSQSYPELEQLICAALADAGLAAQLLADPAQTIDQLHTSFHFSAVERELASAIIHATDIHDYAAQLYARIHQHATPSK